MSEGKENTEPASVTVVIPGKAWHAEPWGLDPHYTMENPSMQEVVDSAEIRRNGKGFSVSISGPDYVLEWFADDWETDGSLWLSQCDEPNQRREARACLEAAKRIREAISNRKVVVVPPPEPEGSLSIRLSDGKVLDFTRAMSEGGGHFQNYYGSKKCGEFDRDYSNEPET